MRLHGSLLKALKLERQPITRQRMSHYRQSLANNFGGLQQLFTAFFASISLEQSALNCKCRLISRSWCRVLWLQRGVGNEFTYQLWRPISYVGRSSGLSAATFMC